MVQSSGRAPASVRQSGEHRSQAEYGSDVIVELLQDLGIPYIALNPGASYRGLHDSLVNFGLTPSPQIVLCCHEEIAVAVAGGYARITGKPMAVGLHDVVGLQHADMAIYMAWCDRMPMLILGGTGPMDTTQRRPHTDWVHTALVQGNQVREYVKWDDQPAAVAAVPESLLRAYRIAMTEPKGPVYLCYDVDLQEEAVKEPPMLPDVRRFASPRPPAANPAALHKAAALLVKARWPLLIAEDMGRNPAMVLVLQELAELLGAGVLDRGSYVNFPSTHPLDLTVMGDTVVNEADVILGLDLIDIRGATGGIKERVDMSTLDSPATVIHITLGDYLQSKWVGDYERLHPVDLPIAADTSEALPALLALCREEIVRDASAIERIEERRRRVTAQREGAREHAVARVKNEWDAKPISSYRLYSELWELVKGTPWVLTGAAGRAPLRAMWEFTEPEQRAGAGRGAGIGYGAAAALGMALAYKDTNRYVINVSGDGSFLMVPELLWTAANSELPLLYVIFDNRTYYNDEGHQEHLARVRGRSIENKGVGIHLDEPPTDFGMLARSFGVAGFGPVTDPAELRPALAAALEVVRGRRKPAVVDVVTQAV